MKRVLARLAVGFLVLATIVLASLPFALPPLVKTVAERRLAELGYPGQVAMTFGYAWDAGPGVAGDLRVRLRDAPWRTHVSFAAGLCRWRARATVPETVFSEQDPVLAKLLRDYPLKAVSNLVFSGSVSLDASVERTFHLPVPAWSVKVPIRGLSAHGFAGEHAVGLDGLSATLAVSGLANRPDCRPVIIRADSLAADGVALTNLTAFVRLTERALLVTEASAGFCGGTVSLYSAFLDPKSLNAGLTLFLEGVDAGETLRHVNGFKGEASGRLHGKLRLFAQEGAKALRFSDGFLYSTPGEVGKIQLEDPEALTGNLALAGLDAAVCGNVAKALTDLDYNILRLDFRRRDNRDATLSVRIEGSATRGSLTVPVDLTININGQIEQLVNTGLGYADKMKGTRK